MKIGIQKICTRETLVDTGVSTVIPKEDYARVDLRVEDNMIVDRKVLYGSTTVKIYKLEYVT